MKFEGKQIAFGLNHVFYTFKNTIFELKTLALEGANIIPIMEEKTLKIAKNHNEAINFIEEIEKSTNNKIIISEEEVENIEMDAIIAAPFCRKSYCKTCIFYI